MTVKLAINGFGRIGRNILRAMTETDRAGFEVVAINDLAPLETSAHLFEFDSVHGRYRKPVQTTSDTIDIGAGPIRYTSQPDPAQLPWSDIDIVLECTGTFRSQTLSDQHLQAGAARVLISGPAQDDTKTIVYGVNHAQINGDDLILSNGSCTTNCLVPVVHVLHEAYGIKRGHMTTVHNYTISQTVHDAPHKDLYRARAAALSMIPTTTGAADTLGVVLPHLKGVITGTAIRVPTPNVSCIDLVVETTKNATPAEINATMHSAARGPLKGVLDITDRKLVSIDFNHDPASAIFATDQTSVQQGNLIRVLAWYDNEWAFSNRMLDTARELAKHL